MSNNKIIVSYAKAALGQIKMEAAVEVGVNLKQGYNGELTSRQAGSIGAQMIENVKTVRTMRFEGKSRIASGHTVEVWYTYELTVYYKLSYTHTPIIHEKRSMT